MKETKTPHTVKETKTSHTVKETKAPHTGDTARRSQDSASQKAKNAGSREAKNAASQKAKNTDSRSGEVRMAEDSRKAGPRPSRPDKSDGASGASGRKKLITGKTEVLDFDMEEVSAPAAPDSWDQMPKEPVTLGQETMEILEMEPLLEEAEQTAASNVGAVPKVGGGAKAVGKTRSGAEVKPAGKTSARAEAKPARKAPAREEPRPAGKSAGKSGSRPVVRSATRPGGKPPRRRMRKRTDGKSEFPLMDRLIAGTGVLVLVVAAVAAGVFMSARAKSGQIAAVAEVGQKMETLGIAGQSVFTAVADARIAAREALEMESESAPDSDGYGEKELTTEVSLGLKLTSIQRDLKIKFTNKNSGKLVGNQPFTVKIEGPEPVTGTDDDEDGIIYIPSIKPGEYTVTVTGPEKMEGKSIVGIHSIVTVRDQIAYEKVDVADEVKTESEIDAAKEDTAVEVTQESLPADTVEWVESTRTPIGDGETAWEQVNKSEIPVPGSVAYAEKSPISWMLDQLGEGGLVAAAMPDTGVGNFGRRGALMAAALPGGELLENVAGAISRISNPSETDTVAAAPTESEQTDPSQKDTEAKEDVGNSGAEEATVSKVSIFGDGGNPRVGDSMSLSAAVTMSDGSDYQGEIHWSATGAGAISGSGAKVTLTASQAGDVSVTASADDVSSDAYVVTFEESGETKPAATVSKVEVSPSSATAKTGEKVALSATVTMSDGSSYSGQVKWTTTGGTLDQSQGTQVNLTSAEAGTFTVTATAEGDAAGTASVTFSEEAVSVTLDAPGTMTVGESQKLKYTVSGEIDSAKTAFTSSDAKVATVDREGNVKALAKGTSIIAVEVIGRNGKTAKAEGTLTVQGNAVNSVSLDYTQLSLKIGEQETITATVDTDGEKGVTWQSSDEKIAKIITWTDVAVTIEAVGPGKATVTAKSKEMPDKTAACEVTVEATDGDRPLLDAAGNQLYVKSGEEYLTATVKDYYTNDVFYRKKAGQYRYTGWQDIDGKRYYFDKNGNAVTGEQIIQGVHYTFNSDGSLQTDSTLGIDVSKHNGRIDWNAVKNAGVNFVIIRCGYRGSATGVLVEDPMFRSNIQGALGAGLKVGVYFFSQAVSEVEAVEEASMAVSLTRKYSISYPIFIDVEAANGRADGLGSDARTGAIRAFCETVRNSGYTAGIYANKNWLSEKMNTGQFGAYRIWLAQYAAAPTYSGRYDVWQYSSKGRIAGISGDVDLDISTLSY